MKKSNIIAKHPLVLSYDIDDTEECPRHDVILKDGCSFHGLDSPRERRTGLFKTVKDFLNSKPTIDKPA